MEKMYRKKQLITSKLCKSVLKMFPSCTVSLLKRIFEKLEEEDGEVPANRKQPIGLM